MTATVLALLAAFTFALSSVLQQRGTLDTQAAEGDPNFLKEVIRKPIWIVGGLLNMLAVVFQVAALSRGSFVVVQSLLLIEPGVCIPAGRALHRSALLAAVRSSAPASPSWGSITLVAFGQPQGSGSMPETGAWLTSGLVLTALMILLTRFTRRRRAAVAAALYGMAAGLRLCFPGRRL